MKWLKEGADKVKAGDKVKLIGPRSEEIVDNEWIVDKKVFIGGDKRVFLGWQIKNIKEIDTYMIVDEEDMEKI